jgi:hypothetical protein
MDNTSYIVSAVTELSYELEELEQTNVHYCLVRAAFGGNLGSEEGSPANNKHCSCFGYLVRDLCLKNSSGKK